MFGLNGGYDSRSLKSGDADVNVTNKKTVGFQQIALNAEAVSNSWTLNGYGLIPVGDVEQRLNSVYDAGSLNTYGAMNSPLEPSGLTTIQPMSACTAARLEQP